jgi:hypothetical protein
MRLTCETPRLGSACKFACAAQMNIEGYLGNLGCLDYVLLAEICQALASAPQEHDALRQEHEKWLKVDRLLAPACCDPTSVLGRERRLFAHYARSAIATAMHRFVHNLAGWGSSATACEGAANCQHSILHVGANKIYSAPATVI